MKQAVAALLLLAAAPPAAVRLAAQLAPMRVGGPIQPPVKIKDVKPVYPAEAQRAGIQGVVIVEIVIDETGRVSKASILRSIPMLDEATLEAVRQWQYTPTLLNGVAMPVIMTATVSFALAPGSGPPPPAADVKPSPAVLERAAALFAEARTSIPSASLRETSSLIPAPWSRQYFQAGMLIELARREQKAFPDQAADDAESAFGMFLGLPGGGPNVDLQPPVTPEKLARMGKMQAEPEAIRILVAAGRNQRALELARTADIDHSDLYDQIVRKAPAERVLELADECRAGDGTYPFVAVADRARALQTESPLRSALLDKVYSHVGNLRDAKYRSLAMMLVQRTYDIVPPAMALGALERLVRDLIAAPQTASGNGRTEADVLGPWILEVMNALDPQRAAALAVDHPDWEAARKTPGRTPGNPVGRSAVGGVPMASLPSGMPPPVPPPVPVAAPASPADFERDLQAARALPDGAARVIRLMQLAESLLKNP